MYLEIYTSTVSGLFIRSDMSSDDRDGLNSLNTDGLHLHTVYLNSEHPNRSHSPKRLAPCFTSALIKADFTDIEKEKICLLICPLSLPNPLPGCPV